MDGVSRFIELVKLQCSGAEHGLMRDKCPVNLVHSVGARKTSIQKNCIEDSNS
jgi:hypothetical protein